MDNHTRSRSGDVSKSDDDSVNIIASIICIMIPLSDEVSYIMYVATALKFYVEFDLVHVRFFTVNARSIHKIKICTCNTFLNLLNTLTLLSIEWYNILKTGLLPWTL